MSSDTSERSRLGLGEVLQQHLQPPVAILGLPEVGFGVEIDGAEEAAQVAS